MIQESELRIGNIIWCGHNCTQTALEGVNTFNKSVKVHSYMLWVPIGCIDPLPLSREWFLKFGFEECPNMYVIDEVEINKCDNGSFRFYYTHSNYIDLKYIHQLQNLHFALTGKELQ